MENRVDWAVVSRTSSKSVRLPNNTSIFRAELHASMRLIRKRKENNFIIFSDSMSSLQALNGFKLELGLIQKILKDYSHLTAFVKTYAVLDPKSRKYTGKRKSWLQQNPHYLFLSLTWDFPPMIWLLMFQSFAWNNGRTYGMPVKAINFALFIPAWTRLYTIAVGLQLITHYS